MFEVVCRVDSREPPSCRNKIASMVAVDEVIALGSGDFSIETEGLKLGIERKTISDFLGSLKSGRLESQLGRMRSDYDIRVLLIEGIWSVKDGKIVYRGRNTGWHISSFLMAVFSLCKKYDVTPMWVPDLNGVGWIVRSFYRRARTKGLSKDASGIIESWTQDAATLGEAPTLEGEDAGTDTCDVTRPDTNSDIPSRNVARRSWAKHSKRGALPWAETVRQLTGDTPSTPRGRNKPR